MSSFTCKCGNIIKEGEEPEFASGLLKPIKKQIDLEEFQAKEISEFISMNDKKRKLWPSRHFGSSYPDDWNIKELIEDFLYLSHRENGNSATFKCPSCGRLAVFNEEESNDWKFYRPE